VNGYREGPANTYYKNEKPKVLANRKKDKLHGTVKEFNKKGELIKVTKYKNGEEINSVKF
jgi:antitoxin component YwqK of YwqJK toxin-antitoxin module